jgi:hypothetical protein
MRKLSGLTYIILCGLAVLSGCNKPAWRSAAQKLEDSAVVVKNKKLVLSSSFFNFSVNQVPAGFPLPALHSFASASYNGLWIFIGGVKNGFHGRTNSPPPFKSHIANDSNNTFTSLRLLILNIASRIPRYTFVAALSGRTAARPGLIPPLPCCSSLTSPTWYSMFKAGAAALHSAR